MKLDQCILRTVAVATGLQSKFDWAGVAAAGIGAGVGQALGGSISKLNLGKYGTSLANNMVGGIANAATRSLVNGSDFGDNLMAALPDIIGNTIGNAIGDGISHAIESKEIDRLQKEIDRVKAAPPGATGGTIAAASASAAPPSTASIGKITVTSMNGGDPRMIVAELANLPADVLRNLERRHVNFVAANDNVGEVITSGMPRGWPPGSTWKDVKAVYQPSTKTVIYATGTRLGTGSINTVLHETGHAIDETNGNASSKKGFNSAWTAESAFLKDYYHPTNGTNPNPSGYLSETYAESFANYYSGNAAYAKTHPALNTYWGSRKW